MSDETGHNGWKNFETWCVNLYLTNDEGTYRYWRDEARKHRDGAGETEEVKECGLSVADAARLGLAGQLRAEIEAGADIETRSLYTDLVSAALSEVFWLDVAAAFLEDIGQGEDEAKGEGTAWEKPTVSDGLKFSLGQVVSTPGALEALTREERATALSRHQRGDWGDCCSEDWMRNDKALVDGSRLFSVYHADDGTRFWVVTEADRSSTCVLLPGEY